MHIGRFCQQLLNILVKVFLKVTRASSTVPIKMFWLQSKNNLDLSRLWGSGTPQHDFCSFRVKHHSHFRSLWFPIHLMNHGFVGFTTCLPVFTCLFSVERVSIAFSSIIRLLSHALEPTLLISSVNSSCSRLRITFIFRICSFLRTSNLHNHQCQYFCQQHQQHSF